MKPGKIVAILIWLITLYQLALVPFQEPDTEKFEIPQWFVLMPVALFATAGLLARKYLFDLTLLRGWVDRRFGPDTYAGFLRQLKPLLLMGVSATLGGALGVMKAAWSNAPQDAYWNNALPLSAGAGFLIARLILARRGLLMESGQTAIPRETTSLLSWNLRATYLTALATGCWTAVGLSVLDSFRATMSVSTFNAVFLVVAVFFFVIPVFVFVFGVLSPDRHVIDRLSGQTAKLWTKAIGRCFCWMLGAVIFSSILSILRSGLAGHH